MPGEEFVNTSWVNHFEVQDTGIGNLDNELYQFKTVGKNPLGESPPSDITEARPLPGVAGMFSLPPPPPPAPVIHRSLFSINCPVSASRVKKEKPLFPGNQI